MNFGGAFKWSSEWPDRTFRYRHIIRAVEVEEPEGVLGAVVNICVTANAGHRQQFELWPYDGAGNCQRVVKAWVTIDDERQGLSDGANWCRAWRETCVMEGRPAEHRRVTHRGNTLSLIVWAASRSWCTNAANETRDHDDRNDVRHREKDLRRQ
jgi:hypothetical protein